MNKFTLLKFTFLLLLMSIFNRVNAQYCNSTIDDAETEYITNVTFAGINNNSDYGVDPNPVDYTSDTANILINFPSNLSVTIQPDADEYIFAFIDWNQNGVLDDIGEVYTIASGVATNGPFTLSITPPSNADTGFTRMRVMVVYGNDQPDPCIEESYGEAEDYTVHVGQASGCNGVPTLGVITQPSNICSGNTFTLSLDGAGLSSGITYQWQYSTIAGTWINLGSPSSLISTTTSITEPTTFRCIGTCTSSNQSDTTTGNEIQINSWLACYCTPTYEYNYGDFSLGGFYSTNAKVNVYDTNSNYFSNYTNYTTDTPIMVVAQGTTVGLHLPLNQDYWWDDGVIKIWIDLNHNGTFETSEIVYDGDPSYGTSILDANITIPLGADTGITRMRIRSSYYYDPVEDPCEEYEEGEGEDYNIRIIEPCNVHITSVLNSSICQGAEATLTATSDAANASFILYNTNDINTTPIMTSSTGEFTIPNLTQTTGYYVGASNGECISDSLASISVDVKPIPQLTDHLFSPTLFCLGDSTQLNLKLGDQTDYTEFFENSLGSFSTFGTGTTPSITDHFFMQGSYALHLIYQDDANGGVELTNGINLSSLTDPYLVFNHIAITESGYDTAILQYSIDGGTTWQNFPNSVYMGSGNLVNSGSNGIEFDNSSYIDWSDYYNTLAPIDAPELWKHEKIDLSSFTTSPDFKIRFKIESDGSAQYFGWLIDSIAIKSSNQSLISWSSIPNTGSGLLYPYNAAFATNDSIKIAPTNSSNYVYVANYTGINGCSNLDTFTSDTIHVLETPNLVINQPNGSCDSFIDLTDTMIVSGTTPSNVIYTYYSDAAGTQEIVDPSHIYTSGTYYIKATNPESGCSKLSSVSVLVHPVAHLILDSLDPICYPSLVWLSTAVNANSNPTMTYSYYTDNSFTNSIPAPGVVGAEGTYFIIGTTYFGCKDTASVHLSILEQPTVLVHYESPYLCHPTTVDITNPAIIQGSTPGLDYTYVSAQTGNEVENPTSISQPGYYWIIGKNGNNCTDTGVVKINFYDSATVSGFNFVPTLGQALGTVTFHPQDAHNVDNYYWEFGDGSSSTESNPTHTYSSNGNYDVLLTVNNNDCPTLADSAILTINVDTFDNSTNVRDIDGLNQFVSLFPVPATEQVQINTTNNDLKIEFIQIYNSLGSVVYESDIKKHTSQNTIKLNALSAGIYNVKIRTNKGLVNKRLEILK